MTVPVSDALIARAAGRFVAIGGRLMINPNGGYEASIDMARLFERTWPNPHDPAPFVGRRRVAMQFNTVERGREAEIADLVRQRGKLTQNGWLVWGEC